MGGFGMIIYLLLLILTIFCIVRIVKKSKSKKLSYKDEQIRLLKEQNELLRNLQNKGN